MFTVYEMAQQVRLAIAAAYFGRKQELVLRQQLARMTRLEVQDVACVLGLVEQHERAHLANHARDWTGDVIAEVRAARRERLLAAQPA